MDVEHKYVSFVVPRDVKDEAGKDKKAITDTEPVAEVASAKALKLCGAPYLRAGESATSSETSDPLNLQKTHELAKTALEALGSVAGQVQRDVDVTEAFKKFPITRTNNSMIVRVSDFVDTLLSKMKALKTHDPPAKKANTGTESGEDEKKGEENETDFAVC